MRNKLGKHFGFTRFVDVEDAHLLTVKSDNIVIGDKKIHANTSRYERKSLVADVGKFKRGGSSSGFYRGHGVEEKHRFRRSVLKVTPLEANKCLLEGLEEAVLKEFLKEGVSWWEKWFLEISKWKEEEVDSSKVVWIGVYGIPVLAWNAYFFLMLANSLGSFISIDNNTTDGILMDLARIQIKLNLCFILPSLVEVLIYGNLFYLLIREETSSRFCQFLGMDQSHFHGL